MKIYHTEKIKQVFAKMNKLQWRDEEMCHKELRVREKEQNKGRKKGEDKRSKDRHRKKEDIFTKDKDPRNILINRCIQVSRSKTEG